MEPPSIAAAMCDPSPETVMHIQYPLGALVAAVQVAPESVET
jgi:hypothetical protein